MTTAYLIGAMLALSLGAAWAATSRMPLLAAVAVVIAATWLWPLFAVWFLARCAWEACRG